MPLNTKNSYLTILLITLSATLYSVPFIYPLTWPLILICLVPLFYIAIQHFYTAQSMISFDAGYLWGAIATIFHLSSVFYSITHSGPSDIQSMVLRGLPLIPIMAYAALYGALWFWLINLSQKYIPVKNIVDLMLRWVIGSALYFYVVANCYMFIFGRVEGYALTNPLLPLAAKSFLIYPLIYCHEFIGLLILITLNAAVSVLLYNLLHKKLYACTYPSVIIFIIICGWLFAAHSIQKNIPDETAKAKELLKEIVHCPCFFYQHTPNTFNVVQVISIILKNAAKKFPQAHTFITQESATRITSFPYTQVLCDPFNKECIERPICFLLGAFRWDNELYHNSLYCFYDGKIQNYHDKRHAMAFEERMPPIINCSILKDAFFGKFTPIDPCKNPRNPFTIYNGIVILPYICSELFFNTRPDEEPHIAKQHLPIIAACNDSWSRLPYTHNLMALHVKYKAIYWQRIIIYDAYHKGLLFTPDGTEYQLAKYSLHDDTKYQAEQ